ncbi:MAG TPA: ribonuclease E/G [Stellaceae bacterium]|nr:ribonuclease E/G [Stellaceae bacterium]
MRRLLIAASPGELRGAVAEADALVDFRLVRTVGRSAVGDLFLGRVVRLQPALRAALIEIGQERPAYLSGDDALPRQDLAGLTEGASVLVQVKRDARADKAAAVTLRSRLRGRWLDWTPARPGVVAEEIEAKRRDRIVARVAGLLREGEGVRLRAGAGEVSPDHLSAAIAAMRARWSAIEERRAQAEPPVCLEAVPPMARLLEALVDESIGGIAVDDSRVLAEVRAWLGREIPVLVERLALHRGPPAIFEAAGVAEAVAGLLELRVVLPGGGAITIEPTAAATLIDVDSGSLEGEGRSGEDAFLAVNLEAATAVARQIRSRGLAGALVVDFIALRRRENRDRLLEAFRTALAAEVSEAQLLGWTRLGHVELTRPRRQAPLHEIVFERTAAGGYIKTALTVALEALATVERRVASEPNRPPELRVHPAVAAVLAGEAAPARHVLEARLGRPLPIVAEQGRARDSFDIRDA